MIFFLAPQADRGGGKVGILILDFHFSTAHSFVPAVCLRSHPKWTSSSELWKCGNLAFFARFPRSGGTGGKPGFGFPPVPWLRHFHSSCTSGFTLSPGPASVPATGC